MRRRMERQEGRGGEGKAKGKEGGFGQITLYRPQKSKSVAQNLETHASPHPKFIELSTPGAAYDPNTCLQASNIELSSWGFSVKARGLGCRRPT